MSPFRRHLAAHGVRHPAAWSILIVIAGMIVCMVTAVTVSVQASNKAIDRAIEVERQNRLAEEARRQEDRAASCAFVKTIHDAYREEPPTTTAGQNVAKAWAGLAARCK